MRAGNNRNPRVEAHVIQSDGFRHTLQQRSYYDGTQGNDYGNHTVSANCTECRPFPFAQFNDVGASGFTTDGGVVFFANQPGHGEEQGVSQEHQGCCQSGCFANTFDATHVNIGYDTSGQYFDVTGHTYDGGNTEARTSCDKYQETTCQDGRCHQGQSYVNQSTHGRSTGNASSFFQGGVHFFHRTGNGDESKGRIEQGQYPSQAPESIDIKRSLRQAQNIFKEIVHIANAGVQELYPSDCAYIRGNHIAGNQQSTETFFTRHISTTNQPSKGEGDDYAGNHN